jgi:hypothetical protein
MRSLSYLSSVLATIVTPQRAIMQTNTNNAYSSPSQTIPTGNSVSTPASSGGAGSTFTSELPHCMRRTLFITADHATETNDVTVYKVNKSTMWGGFIK